MIAHAGGWDELLITVALVIGAFLLLGRGKRREEAETEGGEAKGAGPCMYCGRTLESEDEVCPTCGFRARRGALSTGG